MVVTSSELTAYLEKTFKNSVRIVGENGAGNFSSIWSFLGRTDGFYFGPRSVISSLKISLHANNHRGYVGFDRNYFRRSRLKADCNCQQKRCLNGSCRDPAPAK